MKELDITNNSKKIAREYIEFEFIACYDEVLYIWQAYVYSPPAVSLSMMQKFDPKPIMVIY